MRFVKIEDKEIKDHDFQSLLNFFVQHAFEKFMDNGRSGLSQASEDALHNFTTYIQAHFPDLAKKALSVEEEQKAYNFMRREMMDNFITDGSKGLRTAIVTSYNFLCNEMNEANKKPAKPKK